TPRPARDPRRRQRQARSLRAVARCRQARQRHNGRRSTDAGGLRGSVEARLQAEMVPVSALEELRTLFAEDGSDTSRMRRLAIIVTLRMTDRDEAAWLHSELEAAISLYDNVPNDGRFTLEMLEDHLI